jgi:hypothetical protein
MLVCKRDSVTRAFLRWTLRLTRSFLLLANVRGANFGGFLWGCFLRRRLVGNLLSSRAFLGRFGLVARLSFGGLLLLFYASGGSEECFLHRPLIRFFLCSPSFLVFAFITSVFSYPTHPHHYHHPRGLSADAGRTGPQLLGYETGVQAYVERENGVQQRFGLL